MRRSDRSAPVLGDLSLLVVAHRAGKSIPISELGAVSYMNEKDIGICFWACFCTCW
jgi:hypothetical protein